MKLSLKSKKAKSQTSGMILNVELAVALIAHAARTLVQTVGKFDTLARVKAWYRQDFINFYPYGLL